MILIAIIEMPEEHQNLSRTVMVFGEIELQAQEETVDAEVEVISSCPLQ